uniref:Dehydrogenase/reductase SDR family member 7C n=1 Tax=Lynx canadensis TaxID=61383 RepID=A0A667H1G4_LYNCA
MVAWVFSSEGALRELAQSPAPWRRHVGAWRVHPVALGRLPAPGGLIRVSLQSQVLSLPPTAPRTRWESRLCLSCLCCSWESVAFSSSTKRCPGCGQSQPCRTKWWCSPMPSQDWARTFTPKLVLLDLSDVSCVPDVAKEVLDCYGCVDILINNASMKVKGPAHKISLELDKKIMDANYFGPITLTKALLPDMISRRTGQIVLVNNIQGKLGIPFRTAYAASKHAALGFFDCLRAEVEEYDVVVSTVSPTFVRSYHIDPGQGNWEASMWKFFFRKLTYGVHPVDVAEEVMRTVRRKKQEVFMANPIPKAAMYIRTFFPEFFFAVVACGVKEKLNVPEES